MKTNKDRLVMISVQGTIVKPEHSGRHSVDHMGRPFMLPGTGGITYNVKVGDSAFGWEADHVEPGVSTILDQAKRYDGPNKGYHFYACIGNEAKVVTGDAKGAKGVVTGHHGGAEHVLIDFPDEVLENLNMDDKILIKAFGQGFKLLDHPDIYFYNLDPNLFEKMNVKEEGDSIVVPVVAKIPGMLMGSGIGSTTMGTGDYDIMTADEKTLKKYGLQNLRLGDIVAIMDHDNVFGRCYRKGAVTIGIVIHSDCKYAGHGPGVTTIISCQKPKIKPVIDEDANIAKILGIGRFREQN